jgi:hypothetical protein
MTYLELELFFSGNLSLMDDYLTENHHISDIIINGYSFEANVCIMSDAIPEYDFNISVTLIGEYQKYKSYEDDYEFEYDIDEINIKYMIEDNEGNVYKLSDEQHEILTDFYESDIKYVLLDSILDADLSS